MTPDPWVMVERTADGVHWAEKTREQMVSAVDTLQFLAEGASFLPADPRRQAEVDIPRSTVRLDGTVIKNIDQLEMMLPVDQHPLVWVLCTQIVFATAYECAAAGLQPNWVVCESAPPRTANLSLVTDGQRLATFSAFKDMRALDVVTGRSVPVSLGLAFCIDDETIMISATRGICRTAGSRGHGAGRRRRLCVAW
jgi:hypothetical protein